MVSVITKAILTLIAVGVMVALLLSSSSSPAISSNSISNYTTTAISSTTYLTKCHYNNGLPDPGCTPGSVNQNVTQSNINSTICVSGYTATIRPSTAYTDQLKTQSISDYGYNDTNLSDYEEDHLISLELGGNPIDVKNLWAEPHYGAFNSFAKDGFETYLKNQVCNGYITLAQARSEIAANWVQYWIAAGRP